MDKNTKENMRDLHNSLEHRIPDSTVKKLGKSLKTKGTLIGKF